MHIEYCTSEYEFSHGKLPRGRGSWAFEVDCSSDTQMQALLDPQRQGVLRAVTSLNGHPRSVQLWTRGNTTYQEAKAQVKLFLRAHFEVVSVVVCS